MPISVRPFTPADSARWDLFAGEHPRGSPFHLTGWMNSIRETFGFRPMPLMAVDGDRIRAVLPLFLVNNLLMGKVLLSSPYAVYGGVLADSIESLQAMAEHLRSLGRSLGVEHVELRNAWPEQSLGFSPVSRYVTFTQALTGDEASLLDGLPRKTRRMVRIALKHPYSSRPAADWSAFWDLYSRSLRRLGTPCFPRRHFENLRRHFGDRLETREVLLDGKVVAAVVSFLFRDQILPYYGASDPAFNEFAPNNFMYFDMMRRAAGEGLHVFDFGRSKKESGSFDFKAHWGMEVRELPYEMLLVGRRNLPDYSPNNPRYRWAIQAWRRVPLPITRTIGPWLLKLVP